MMEQPPLPSDSEDQAANATRPSTVRLPELVPDDVTTIYEFFLRRFPRIAAATWEERFETGKVWTRDGAVSLDMPYEPLMEVHYRREVDVEPPVRTDVRIVWRDEHVMVVDKPPHLPVIPGGRWVRNCLLHLLAEQTGETRLTPLHRIDRLTSGLVAFSHNPASRGFFARLFSSSAQVEKTYTAVCEFSGKLPPDTFTLADHITRSDEEYWRQIVLPGQPANARAVAETVRTTDRLVLLRIRLQTGRKHQIRVQLANAGLPILGDPLYGPEQSYDPCDLKQRLWLDAHRVFVRDLPAPDGGSPRNFEWFSSRQPLEFLSRASALHETPNTSGR